MRGLSPYFSSSSLPIVSCWLRGLPRIPSGQIGEQERRIAVGDVRGAFGPDDGIAVAAEPCLDHLLDAGADLLVVPADLLRLLFDQQGDVRVLLEAVPRPVEVEVEALFLEFLEASHRGRAVEVGADADGQQLGLGHAWRQ